MTLYLLSYAKIGKHLQSETKWCSSRPERVSQIKLKRPRQNKKKGDQARTKVKGAFNQYSQRLVIIKTEPSPDPIRKVISKETGKPKTD